MCFHVLTQQQDSWDSSGVCPEGAGEKLWLNLWGFPDCFLVCLLIPRLKIISRLTAKEWCNSSSEFMGTDWPLKQKGQVEKHFRKQKSGQFEVQEGVVG